ncbi:MFS transporter, partial [Streptomyces rubrogriseus]
MPSSPSSTTPAPTSTPAAGWVPSGKGPSGAAARLFLPLIALCTAVTAANIYLAAPLLPLIAHDMGSTPSGVAWLASVAQLGYAAGLLFFAPLGDSVNRRRLVAALSLVATAALLAAAASAGTGALAG